MPSPIDDLPEDLRERAKEESFPDWVEPMLAKLTHDPFSHENWIYERKLDGQRCLAFCRDGEVRLMSRNEQEMNLQYPELVGALEEAMQYDCVIDGEVVAFEGELTSFARLQQRMHLQDASDVEASDVEVYYYLFDVMYLDGHTVDRLPLLQRKTLLEQALEFGDPLRYTEHRTEEGLKFLEEACEAGWEGLIAKDAESTYIHSRSSKWLKFKCERRQEFVVGGFTEPKGSRIEFGALLLGYYEGDALQYAGKVGTGFSDRILKELGERLAELEQDDSPFADADVPSGGVHWIAPELVVEVAFTEWTSKNRLRHPRYMGLRTDKEPQDVVKEG